MIHHENKNHLETILRTEHLSKEYSGGTKALNSVSFNAANELSVILGPSGAGKSTLLRCLNRMIEPTSGKIFLDGKDVTFVRGSQLRLLREQTGMIFQQFNLVKRLTVLENVLIGRLSHCPNVVMRGLSLFKVFPRAEKEFAMECLEQVGIGKLALQCANNLSGGQQQRVAIARVLAQEPEVILADEPVASLDPASAEIVMELLTAIQRSHNIPVIVNLHQIELARDFADRVIGMSAGEIVFEGATQELTSAAVEKIYGVEVDEKTGRPKVDSSSNVYTFAGRSSNSQKSKQKRRKAMIPDAQLELGEVSL